MRPPVVFTVFGKPEPQPRPRARALPPKFGKRWVAQIYNPKDADPWKQQVVDEYLAMKQPLFEGPLKLTLIFHLPRPQAHYTTKGRRPNAPKYCITRPDIDNLAKAVMDALTEHAWKDDSQVSVISIQKIYANTFNHAKPILENVECTGVSVEIRECEVEPVALETI